MQVMLVKDVSKLGRVGDIVAVKGGYARNYLIPQGLAVLATSGALKQAQQLRRTDEKARARDVANAQAFASTVGAHTFRFERKVGERGRLYGSVTSSDIAERIDEVVEMLESFDKRKVQLDEPIKQLGLFEVSLFVHPDVPASVKVEVIGDQGERAEDYVDEAEGDEEPAVADDESVENEVEPQPQADY